MKKAISELKAEIQIFTANGREIGKRIRQSSGLDRFQLWNEKRWLGKDARIRLLAYACLRGRPYACVERKVRQGNEPSATAIHNIIVVLDDIQKDEWTRERVKAWLEEKLISTIQETTEVAA